MECKIPKIIHYCWFGNGEKTTKIKECIQSWEKELSEYKFIEWNESKFDVNENEFTRSAYEHKKYAFVADYVRAFAILNYGGIYLDTDVIVKKKFDEFLNHECFMGFEIKNFVATSTFGCTPQHWIPQYFLNYYNNHSFVSEDGHLDLTTNVKILTDELSKRGLICNGKHQILDENVAIYPMEYFSPYDYINDIDNSTRNTHTVHLFDLSWGVKNHTIKRKIKRFLNRLFHDEFIKNLREKMNA